MSSICPEIGEESVIHDALIQVFGGGPRAWRVRLAYRRRT